MQQPLCHLYFLTIMEHYCSSLNHSESSQLPNMVTQVLKIQQELKDTSDDKAVVLWVELQVVIQVLIQHLAEHLNPMDTRRLGDVSSCLSYINE